MWGPVLYCRCSDSFFTSLVQITTSCWNTDFSLNLFILKYLYLYSMGFNLNFYLFSRKKYITQIATVIGCFCLRISEPNEQTTLETTLEILHIIITEKINTFKIQDVSLPFRSTSEENTEFSLSGSKLIRTRISNDVIVKVKLKTMDFRSYL